MYILSRFHLYLSTQFPVGVQAPVGGFGGETIQKLLIFDNSNIMTILKITRHDCQYMFSNYICNMQIT